MVIPELKPHQKNAVKNLSNKSALFFSCRVGKTPTLIKLADTRVKSCLVIVPKYLKIQWENEIAKWSDGSCKFMVITKETFRRDAKKLKRYEALAWDEVHMAGGNFKSQLFKQAKTYIKVHQIEYVWLLTGTPYTSSPWCVYSYGLLLDRNFNWYKFKQMFFYDVKFGRRTVPIPKKNMDGELQKLLKSMGTIINLKDVAEIAENYEEVEYFDLNVIQKKEIENITDILPIVKFTKIHQLESGCLKGNAYEEGKIFECEKDKRLLEIVSDTDKPIIVVRYLALIEKYKKLLEPLKRPIFAISGEEKENAVEVAKKAENEAQAIVIVQADTCVGYSLKSFSTMVFASLSYSFVNYVQIKARITAMDKKTPNTYITLLTNGKSVDKAIFEALGEKRDFDTELFNYENTKKITPN